MENKKIKNFFNKKKILITGHTGFVGSNLSIILTLFGADILGYSLKKNTEDICLTSKNLKN